MPQHNMPAKTVAETERPFQIHRRPRGKQGKAVRRIVSGVTSQENVLPSKAVTVRQVPLTAILSPAFVPSSTLWQAIVSRQELPVRSTF